MSEVKRFKLWEPYLRANWANDTTVDVVLASDYDAKCNETEENKVEWYAAVKATRDALDRATAAEAARDGLAAKVERVKALYSTGSYTFSRGQIDRALADEQEPLKSGICPSRGECPACHGCHHTPALHGFGKCSERRLGERRSGMPRRGFSEAGRRRGIDRRGAKGE